MAGLGFGFNLLPALCEGDEHIALSDILAARDDSLKDEELWAVCHECCMALQSVYNSSEMFQYLCVMPETLAFDTVGAVCFLDMPSDPSTIYIPPEYATVGNSFKAHLYSLGMTMMFAAEYNAPLGAKRELSPLLTNTLSKMTADEYDDRITLDQVLTRCNKALVGKDPAHICYQLAASAKLDVSIEDVARLDKIDSSGGDISSDSFKDDEEEEELTAPYTFTTRKLLGKEEGPRAASSPKGFSSPGASPTLKHKLPGGEGTNGEVDSGDEACSPKRANIDPEEDRVVDPVIDVKPPTDNREQLSPVMEHTVADISVISDDNSPGTVEAVMDNPAPGPDDIKEVGESGQSTTIKADDGGGGVDSGDKDTEDVEGVDGPEGIDSPAEEEEELEVPREGSPSPTLPGVVVGRLGRPPVSRSGGQGPRTPTGSSQPFSTALPAADTPCAGYDSGYSSQNTVLTPEPVDSKPEPAPGPQQPLQDADILDIATGLDEDAANTTEEESTPELTREASGAEDMDEETDPANPQAQSVFEILEKLGCGLHEGELWSLCRECVLSLQKSDTDLPAYISLETVYIEETGEILYMHAAEDEDLDVVYLAPELQQYGVVTEKTCLFGIAAMLWSAADYKMPSNQEPALSEQFENLLVSMTQENSELRPTMSDVLQACNTFHKQQGVNSTTVCQTLSTDAKKAHQFNGKNNALVRDLIDEDLEQKVHDYKARILDDIREAQVQLKPASERQLAQRTIEINLHDKLMAEILNPQKKLRKASKPRVMSVKEMYDCNPEFLNELARVTGKQRQATLNNNFHSDSEPLKSESEGGTSAFSSINVTSDNSPSGSGGESLPAAYRSTATHFTPIVITGNEEGTGKERREKPRTRQLPKPDKDIDVAKKIRELKKNLMKNRAPLNLAQDLEADVLKEEEADRKVQQQQGRPHSEDRPRNGRLSPGEPRPRSEDTRPRSGDSRPRSGESRPFSGGRMRRRSPAPSEKHVLKLAKEDFMRYQEFGTDADTAAEEEIYAKPINTQPQQYISAQSQVSPEAQLQQHKHGLNLIHQQVSPQQYMLPQQQSQPPPLQPPPPLPGHGVHMQGQGVPLSSPGVALPRQGQAMTMSPHGQYPGYPYPMSMPGAMFPFQVQLQQDPITGLFQIIPVPVSAVPTPNGAISPQDNNSSPVVTTPPVIGRPSSGGSAHTQSTANQNSPRSPPNVEEVVEKTIPKKPPRQSKKEVEPQRVSQRSRSDGSGDEVKRSGSQAEVKARSQSQRMLRRTASHTESSTSLADNSFSHHKAKTNLSRTDSVERLDKIDEIPKVKPKKLRELKQKSKIRRAKSGSSLDFKNSMKELRAMQVYDDSVYFNHNVNVPGDSLQYSNGLSKSQPSLNENGTGGGARERRRRRRHRAHGSPEDGSPSPPLSPSWSKDSGVSGVNLKGTGDLTLMERLLSSDTIKHQQKLSRVIRLLREEFAFDGYMENGIEDLAMAEYILSLANLRWDTFVSAVTEKYCDLYWSDDLLTSLFEAVNGAKPRIDRRLSEKKENVSPVKQKKEKPSPKKSAPDTQSTDCYDGSAFRPISGASASQNLNNSGPIVKPKALKLTSSDETDSSEPTAKVKKSKPPRKRILDQQKSSSLHNLTESSSHDEGQPGVSKAKSDKDLTQSVELSYQSPGITLQSLAKTKYSASFSEPKPRIIYVKSNSLVESTSGGNSPHGGDQLVDSPFAMPSPESVPITSQSCMHLNRYDSDSSSVRGGAGDNRWESLRVDPDKPRGLRVVRSKTSVRKESFSSESSAPSLQYNNVHRKFSLVRGVRNESTDALTDTEGGDLGEESPRPAPRDTPGSHGTVDELIHRGAVVYYAAEMEGNLRTDVKDLTSQVDIQTKENIEAKLSEIKQNILMEEKNKRKTLKYYSRLIETTKSNKVTTEHKNKLVAVSKQLAEANDKLKFLDAAHKHLEMLHAEQWGVDHDLLYALAKCPGDQPMLLSACDNLLIQHQPLRNPKTGMNAQALQAGMPLGLCTYLYAQHALSEGFIHQFFYCYRYFLTPHELLQFLCDKFSAATLSLSPDAQIPAKVKARTLDLFQVWLEGYFSVDFLYNSDLQNSIRSFIRDKVLSEDSGYKHLLELLECCRDGNIAELSYKDFVSVDNTSLDDDIEVSASAKKWETMKAALHLSAKPQRLQAGRPMGCLSSKQAGEAYHPRTGPRRTDSFTLGDYTPQVLAEQLTIMEQDLFLEVHPVYYLNSRAQGISVALAKPVMSKTQSLSSINSAWEDHHSNSLFEGSHVMDDTIQRIIEHSQSISFWVAAEILSCNSSKAQTALLSKFIYTAKACEELRNYASCMAIIDGLENIIIRQLPVWKSIPTKCGAILDDLSTIKMQLKGDSMWLVTHQIKPLSPMIPCTFLFLLHVQQQEIGGFKLANGMYKWQKMRNLCRLIDQIRIFKQRRYCFTADEELHESIRQRMREFGQQDLHALASQHQTNFQKVIKKPSIFRRMTGKFQRKSDV